MRGLRAGWPETLLIALLLVIAGLTTAMAAGLTAATAESPAALPAHPAASDLAGRQVTVAGARLHIDCQGRPGPRRGITVVFDAGLGDSALVWSRVQPAVARHVRACSYDRAGYGDSDARLPPRTSQVITRELHALLAAAGIAPPYVLVGHSFGGWNMQLFASTWPDETAALVLVDSSQVDQIERYARETGTVIAPKGDFHLNTTPFIPPNLPPAAAEQARELTYNPLTWRTAHNELVGFRDSEREVAAARPLPHMPMVLISRGETIAPTDQRAARREQLWRTLQQEFVDRHPGTIHLVAHDSGHYIQLQQPRLVIEGICIALRQAGEPIGHCSTLSRPPGLVDSD